MLHCIGNKPQIGRLSSKLFDSWHVGYRPFSSLKQRQEMHEQDLEDINAETFDVASTSAGVANDDGLSAAVSRDEPVSHLFHQNERFREDIYVDMNRKVVEEQRRYNEVVKASEADASDVEYADDGAQTKLLEWQVERARDLSGLRAHHRWHLNGYAPPMDAFGAWQWDRKALQQRYARYGRASGVNPGIMWMTDEELAEQKVFDVNREPELDVVSRQVRLETRKQERLRKEREAEIDKKVADYPRVYQEWQEEIKQEQETKAKEKAAHEARLLEIKEQFGYYIDLEDKRFKKLVEEKEKMAKRAAKADKKKDKVVIKV